MTPLYFGPAARRLYGVYHAPTIAAAGAARAVVVCNPWGPEYDHTHRVLRQLADALAGAGMHVMRFDYYGTGDAAGAADEGDLDGWIADIAAAIGEVRALSGAARLTLIGLRLGAYLAARAAGARPRDVDRLVLWDPVVSRDYWADIGIAARRYTAMQPAPRRATPGVEVFGQAIGERLVEQLGRIDTPAAVGAAAAATTLVVSGDDAAFARARHALGDTLEAAVHLPTGAAWDGDVVWTTWFVPRSTIAAIVAAAAAAIAAQPA